MEAKLKDSYRWASAQLLNGNEFVKSEWRRVPEGMEEAAKAEEYLELRETPLEAKVERTPKQMQADARDNAKAEKAELKADALAEKAFDKQNEQADSVANAEFEALAEEKQARSDAKEARAEAKQERDDAKAEAQVQAEAEAKANAQNVIDQFKATHGRGKPK